MATERRGARIELANVTKTFALATGEPLTAVDCVSLTIKAGETIALTGASGSGKSTLLHLIGAIEQTDSGTILVGHRPIHELDRKRLAEYRRTVGFVFQRYHLLPALTALDNVLVPALPYAVDFDKAERARQLLAAVGLDGREGQLPSRLSGGQQQRLAIARALINRPALLLADEPTGNLDSTTGEEVLDLLDRLREESGMTMIIATHDPTIAGRCERHVTLKDGAIIADSATPAASSA